MGTAGTPRAKKFRLGSISALSDERLDPVRWRRPHRGTLFRWTAVAALLTLAAATLWFRPQPSTSAAVQPGSTDINRASPSAVASLPRPRTLSSPSSAVQDPASTVPAGHVGVAVRLADQTALALVHPGNRVDLLRLDDSPQGSTRVATAVQVLTVANGSDPVTGGLLLALTPAEATAAVGNASHGFAVLIRPN